MRVSDGLGSALGGGAGAPRWRPARPRDPQDGLTTGTRLISGGRDQRPVRPHAVTGAGDVGDVHHYFGEGDYEQSERMIQQLRAEAGGRGVGHELVAVDARGIEAAADWDSLQSPENYVGYERTENFASPGGAASDQRRVYAVPARLKLNQWALSSDWTVGKQATLLNQANGRIAYRFHARDLHLVMGPAARGRSVRFHVLIDGQPVGAVHGGDVDDQGNGTVTQQRLYQLIRQPKPIADRQVAVGFLDSGVETFAFTFG